VLYDSSIPLINPLSSNAIPAGGRLSYLPEDKHLPLLFSSWGVGL